MEHPWRELQLIWKEHDWYKSSHRYHNEFSIDSWYKRSYFGVSCVFQYCGINRNGIKRGRFHTNFCKGLRVRGFYFDKVINWKWVPLNGICNLPGREFPPRLGWACFNYAIHSIQHDKLQTFTLCWWIVESGPIKFNQLP